MNMEIRSVTGVVIDDDQVLTLAQLCRYCGVHAELIIEMVDEGVVQPEGGHPREWRFPGGTVVRIQRAVRLTRDLGVNLPGAALALELMDELSYYRSRFGRATRD